MFFLCQLARVTGRRNTVDPDGEAPFIDSWVAPEPLGRGAVSEAGTGAAGFTEVAMTP